MASGADSMGDGGDPGDRSARRFDVGQGAGQVGNAPLEPGDTRHTAGRGYDPATGNALPVPAGAALAGLHYDPVTQTVDVDVEGPEGTFGGLGGYKDAIPDAVTPASHELGHTDHGGRDPRGPAAVAEEEGGEEEDEGKAKK